MVSSWSHICWRKRAGPKQALVEWPGSLFDLGLHSACQPIDVAPVSVFPAAAVRSPIPCHGEPGSRARIQRAGGHSGVAGPEYAEARDRSGSGARATAASCGDPEALTGRMHVMRGQERQACPVRRHAPSRYTGFPRSSSVRPSADPRSFRRCPWSAGDPMRPDRRRGAGRGRPPCGAPQGPVR